MEIRFSNFTIFFKNLFSLTILNFFSNFPLGIVFAHSALPINTQKSFRNALWAPQLHLEKNVICCVTLYVYVFVLLSPISVRPLVHVPVQKVNASPGRKVQIECNIESYPRADITWEFTGDRAQPPTTIESDYK